MTELTCAVCQRNCKITIEKVDGEWIIKGNECEKGIKFAVDWEDGSF